MTTAAEDAVLATLLLPLQDGRVTAAGSETLFLRARYSPALQELDVASLHCEQSFRPEALALQRAGLAVSAGPSSDDADTELPQRRYGLVLMLPPRQRDEARALMARAVAATAPGGRIVACVSNSEGARASEGDLQQLTGPVETYSKNKCRVFWTAPLQAAADPALHAAWLKLDAIRPILDGRFISRPGVFAWDRIDPASALLAAHLPNDLRGRAADLGAGFGYLAAELLRRCQLIASLDLFEAEQRALELARLNLAADAARRPLNFHWHDVTTGLPAKYNVIITNPPFHTPQHGEQLDVGRRFIAVAAEALEPGGSLWLVANRHLPYEAVLNASFGRVRSVAQLDGFKIIEAVRMVARAPLRRMRS